MQASTRKTVGWTVMAFVVALWIFVVFFFDGILGHLAEQKLIGLVASATHGEYQLSFQSFDYHRGVIDAKGMDMRRVGYRATEYGTTLRDLGIKDVGVTGISWWEVIFGKPIALGVLQTQEPRVYMCDVAQDKDKWKLLPPYTPEKSTSNTSVSFDSVLIPGLWIYGQQGTTDRQAGVLSFSCQDLTYDSKSNAPLNLTEKHFKLDIPWIQYADSGTLYLVRNARLTTTDSILAIDTFAYVSGSSPTQFHGSGLRADEINFVRALAGKGIAARKLQADTWGVAFAADTTHPQTQQQGLSWQDQLARSAGFPIKIDSLLLNGGDLDIHFAHAAMVEAQDLALHIAALDFDSGAPADRPGFSQAFDLAANSARYASSGTGIALTNFHGNIQDSLITAGSVVYDAPSHAPRKRSNDPVRFDNVRADGIGFTELMAGTEIVAHSVDARGWNISGLPTSSTSKKSKAKSKSTANSIWASQEDIAKSVGIPIRIGRIDLTGGHVHVMGGKTLTILAEGASIDAVNFNMDSTAAASKKLFFSKDVNVGASKFHFADVGNYNLVDMSRAHTRLGGRSISAGSASYTSRSKFEPSINYETYRVNNMDMTGIDFTGLMDNKQIALSSLSGRSWAITGSSDTVTHPPSSTAPANQNSKSSWKLPILVGHVSLPNGAVLFRVRDTVPGGFTPTLTSKITKFDVTEFRFLPPKGKRPRLGYDQVLFAMPSFTYQPLNGFYAAKIRNLNANLKDSLVTMDSLGYEPIYSEDKFTAMHQYARGRTDFRLANVQIVDIDARRMINGGGLMVNKFIVPTLWMDYYKDMRKPSDPHPSPAVMPNDIVRKLNLPITVQYIDIKKGHIQLREKTQAGVPTGDFTFDSVSVDAAPITFDSASQEVDSATTFNLTGYLIGQSPAHVTMIYPLHDSELNLTVKGTAGPFDLKQLNQFLVNAERVEVTNGNFYHADIDMTIRHDIATTYVAPIYNHFKLRVLDREPGQPGLGHRLETFVANTFVLRDDNPDEKGGPPTTATTTLTRDTSQEFFQFLWFSIRKSLGTVVGGFK